MDDANVRKRRVVKTSQDLSEGVFQGNKEESGASSICKNVLVQLWRIAMAIIKYTFVALLLSVFLNYTALLREERELKPKGTFIKTDEGQTFYVNCTGEGTPTVILDAPNGMNSDVWASIVPSIADVTKVCTYDRAGIGYSDRPGKNSSTSKGLPHSVESMTEDIRDVFVKESKIERPFIMMGVELSAVNAIFYAQMYPDDVAALVLINPYHDRLFEMKEEIWTKYWYGTILASLQLLHFSSVSGFTRIGLHLRLLKERVANNLNDGIIQSRQRYLMCKPGHVSSAVEENFMVNTSLSQLRLMRKLRPFPASLSTTVLSSDIYSTLAPDNVNELWKHSQRRIEETLSASIKQVNTMAPAERVLEDAEDVTLLIKNTILEWRKMPHKERQY